MRSFLLIPFIFCFSIFVNAQCPTGNIILETQADVDAFTTTYPNCTQLQADLWIGSYSTGNFSDINNLTALSGITSIGGRLVIEQVNQLPDLAGLSNLVTLDDLWLTQTQLTSLNGLQNLTGLENLRIFNNNTTDYSALNHLTSLNQLRITFDNVLTDLSAFDHFTEITFLELDNNYALTSINAFNNLTAVPPFGNSNITIDDHPALTNLNAFQNVQALGILEINSNPQLSSLSDFSNLTSLNRLRIYGNGMTTMIDNFQSLTTLSGLATIAFNPNLTTINDFNNLTNIQSVGIINHQSLQSVTGFNQISSFGTVQLVGNTVLNSVNAFNNASVLQSMIMVNNPALSDLTSIGTMDFTNLNSLQITGNSALSVCNVPSVCAYLNSGNAVADIQNNAHGCNSPIEVASGCNLNVVTGNVFFDANSNNTLDANDVPAAFTRVTSTGPNGTFSTFTRSNGDYNNYTLDGAITTSVDPVANFAWTPSSHSNTFTGTGNGATGRDFLATVTNVINDVSISVIPTNAARPGFEARYNLIIKNEGTQVSSGAVTLNYDSTYLTYTSSSETPASATTGNLSFNYSNLNLFETRIISLAFNVALPPALIGGEILDFTAQINPAITDINPANNTNLLAQTVVNSYDPNDKQVFEGDEILPSQLDEYLHYLIRFQNTGSASAINVVVTDTLTNNLDWSTFEPLHMSHPMGEVHIENERYVDFEFPNINLPDSTSNEPLSHGYIYYRIKPKQNLVLGDQMDNTAHIFFDFNEAIITNTTITTVVQTLSAREDDLFQVIVHPNPVKDILNIQTESPLDRVELYNLQGQLMTTTTDSIIDITGFKTGMYILKIHNQEAQQTLKIVKD